MSNYRKGVIDRVKSQLEKLILVVPGSDPPRRRPLIEDGALTPNAGYNTPCWKVIERPTRPNDDAEKHTLPAIYLSFLSGRLDEAENNLIQNKAERVNIQIEVILDSNRGARLADDSKPPKVQSLTDQTSGILDDLDRLLNFDEFRTSEFFRGEQTSTGDKVSYIMDANIIEWGFDPTKRGTTSEVLTVIFEVLVSMPKKP